MKTFLGLMLVIALQWGQMFCVAGLHAQPAAMPAQPFRIERVDPALDALIAPNAKLKTIATGFGFIDTPVSGMYRLKRAAIA